MIWRWAFPGVWSETKWELCFPRRKARAAKTILIAENVGDPNLPWVLGLTSFGSSGKVHESGFGEKKEDGNLLTLGAFFLFGTASGNVLALLLAGSQVTMVSTAPLSPTANLHWTRSVSKKRFVVNVTEGCLLLQHHTVFLADTP